MTETLQVPFHKASLGPDERSYVDEVLKSGWITTGLKAKEFECLCAKYLETKNALAVSSGTAALAICYRLAGFSGKKVIVPSYTFASCITELLHLGATPVLVDIDENTMNIDIDKALQLAEDTGAQGLVVVHFAGQPCDMNRLESIKSEGILSVVDDACHAFGSKFNGRRIGNFDILSAFSFYATKNITTGEGGLISSADSSIYARARALSLHGISTDAWNRYSADGDWFYEIIDGGYKANLPDILAAIGIAQVVKADILLEKRKAICLKYDSAFENNNALVIPLHKQDESSYHLYPLRLRLATLSITRSDFIRILKEKGIHCSVHFIPVHLHPYFKRSINLSVSDLSISERVFSSEVSLPLFPDMTSSQIEYVILSVLDIVKKYRR